MKYPILTLCLFGVVYSLPRTSAGQSTSQAVITRNATPVYRALADTVEAARFLSIGDAVDVVKQAGRWTTILRGKSEYIVGTRFLQFTTPPTQDQEASAKTVTQNTPPVYAVARTSAALLKRTARLLILDVGIKTPLTKPFYTGPDGQPLQFETEAVVLNWLDAQGWQIVDSRQDLTTEAQQQLQQGMGKKYEYDTVYILKRKNGSN